MVYEATSLIEATPEAIWTVLVDGTGYGSWNNGVVRIDGSVAAGEKLKVYSEVDPKRGFAAKVTEFAPGERMTWSGGMPLGLFRGVRTFTLAPEGEATRFTMREEFSGPLLGMISKKIPDLGPSFERFAQGLKAKAEAG